MHMHRPASDLDGFFDSLHRDYGDIAYYAVGGKSSCAAFSAELTKGSRR